MQNIYTWEIMFDEEYTDEGTASSLEGACQQISNVITDKEEERKYELKISQLKKNSDTKWSVEIHSEYFHYSITITESSTDEKIVLDGSEFEDLLTNLENPREPSEQLVASRKRYIKSRLN